MAQNALILYVLDNSVVQQQYATMFSKIQYPSGWSRLQNPLRHRLSWTLAEQARALLLTGLILRKWLTINKIKTPLRRALELEYSQEIAEFRSLPGAPELNAAGIITRTFMSLAASYAATTKSTLTSEDRDAMERWCLAGRKAFQRLIQAAVVALPPPRKKKTGEGTPAPSTAGSANTAFPSELGSQVNSIAGFSCASNDASETDEQLDAVETGEPTANDEETVGACLGDTAVLAKPGSRKKKGPNTADLNKKQLARWAHRPNVHIGLHYPMYAQHFGTLWNAVVLIGEAYHKVFKRAVINTNHKVVEFQLLYSDGQMKTIRMVLEGSYRRSMPRLTARYTELRQKCSRLMEAYLTKSDTEMYTTDGPPNSLQPTDMHVRPRVTGRFSVDYVRYTIRMPTKLPLSPNEESGIPRFLDKFRVALQRDYGHFDIYSLGRLPIKYFNRLQFHRR